MAATKKTKAAAKPEVEAEVKVDKVETVEVVEKVEKPAAKVKRKYRDDDKIPCFSITPGEYLFEGGKSKMIYSWINQGVTEEMRYDDLTAAIRTRKPCVFKPRIIIQDDEFLEEYPEIQRLYDSMYSKDDLSKILTLDARRMTEVINSLPDGAKDAIKTLAVEAIDKGTLDSVARVRALDRIFGTDMLLKLAN